jgi:hypothetical protein
VAPILDLAVVALALMVSVTLGMLAWTLGVTIPRAARRTRRELIDARLQLTVAERRLRDIARGDR